MKILIIQMEKNIVELIKIKKETQKMNLIKE
jgi:hypothetical protein